MTEQLSEAQVYLPFRDSEIADVPRKTTTEHRGQQYRYIGAPLYGPKKATVVNNNAWVSVKTGKPASAKDQAEIMHRFGRDFYGQPKHRSPKKAAKDLIKGTVKVVSGKKNIVRTALRRVGSVTVDEIARQYHADTGMTLSHSSHAAIRNFARTVGGRITKKELARIVPALRKEFVNNFMDMVESTNLNIDQLQELERAIQTRIQGSEP